MSRNRKLLATNFFSVGFVQVCNYLFPLFTIPFVARIIGAEKLGTVNFLSAFIAYFTLFINYGFNTTAVRKLSSNSRNDSIRNAVFSEVFSTQCLLFIASSIIFYICLNTVPGVKEEKIVAVFTYILCVSAVFTQNWLFQAMQELPKVAVINLISKIGYTVFVFAVIRSESDYIWLAFGLSLSTLFAAIISFYWSIRRYKIKFSWINWRRCLALLVEGKTYFFSICVIYIYTNTLVFILGLVHNNYDVGVFTAAQKVVLVINGLLIFPLSQTFFPYVGQAFSSSYDNGIKVVQKLFPLVFLGTLVVGILTLIFAPTIIMLLYGEAFADAVAVLRILSFVPMMISLCTIWGHQLMINLKMDREYLKITSTTAIFSGIAGVFLILFKNFIGTAVTWLLAESFNTTLVYIYLRRKGICLISSTYIKSYFSTNIITMINKFAYRNR